MSSPVTTFSVVDVLTSKGHFFFNLQWIRVSDCYLFCSVQVLFYCETPTAEGCGGESVLADVREILPKLDQAVVEEFSKRGCKYHYNWRYRKIGFNRTWPEVRCKQENLSVKDPRPRPLSLSNDALEWERVLTPWCIWSGRALSHDALGPESPPSLEQANTFSQPLDRNSFFKLLIFYTCESYCLIHIV